MRGARCEVRGARCRQHGVAGAGVLRYPEYDNGRVGYSSIPTLSIPVLLTPRAYIYIYPYCIARSRVPYSTLYTPDILLDVYIYIGYVPYYSLADLAGVYINIYKGYRVGIY